MKNRIFALLVSGFVMLSLQLHAQNVAGIDAGAEAGLPSGNFANVSAIGFGASIKANIPLSPMSSITLNGGIMNFLGRKNQLIQVQDLTYLPGKLGFRYQLGESFYAEGQLGAALPLHEGQKAVFIWSPGIGNQFKMAGKNRLDLGIRYEAWNGKNDDAIMLRNSSTAKGFVGIRFAYVFTM